MTRTHQTRTYLPKNRLFSCPNLTSTPKFAAALPHCSPVESTLITHPLSLCRLPFYFPIVRTMKPSPCSSSFSVVTGSVSSPLLFSINNAETRAPSPCSPRARSLLLLLWLDTSSFSSSTRFHLLLSIARLHPPVHEKPTTRPPSSFVLTQFLPLRLTLFCSICSCCCCWFSSSRLVPRIILPAFCSCVPSASSVPARFPSRFKLYSCSPSRSHPQSTSCLLSLSHVCSFLHFWFSLSLSLNRFWLALTVFWLALSLPSINFYGKRERKIS